MTKGVTQLELPAVPEAVREGREAASAAAEQLGLAGAVLEDLRLCVSEAITNAVRHAYDGTPGTIDVHVEAYRLGVLVVVRDFGSWSLVPQPRSPECGGFGLKIMRTLADEYSLEATDRGTAVSMAFGIASQ